MAHQNFFSLLGSGNCLPKMLSDFEKTEILEQLVINCMSNLNLKPDIVSKLANKVYLYQKIVRQIGTDNPVALFCHQMDLPRAKGIKLLAEDLGFNAATIFQGDLKSCPNCKAGVPPLVQYSTPLDTAQCLSGEIYREYTKRLHSQGINYYFRSVIPYVSTGGDVVAIEAWYENDLTKEYFFINAYPVRHEVNSLCGCKDFHLGYHWKKYRISNEDLILSHQNKPVCLFHDKRIALKLTQKWYEKGELAYIPSSSGGQYFDTSSVDYEHLHGRSVYICPLPARESFRAAEEQIAKIREAGAANIQVVDTPGLFYQNSTSESSSSISDSFDRYLINHSIFIDEWTDSFSSIPAEKFSSWLKEYGLKTEDSIAMGYKSVSPRELGLSISAEQEWDRMLHPGRLTGIVGPPESSKSLLALTIAYSVACGFESFGFTSAGKHHVLYIDAEAPGSEKAHSCQQIESAYACSSQDVEKYIHYLPLRNSQKSITPDDMDGFKSDIEGEIYQTRAKLVIFDTLIGIDFEAVQTSKKWNTLHEWFNKLSNTYGAAILYVHHTDKEGREPLGPVHVKAQTDTLIRLKPLAKPQGHKGAYLELTFEKNKAYPGVSGEKTVYAFNYVDDPTKATPWRVIDEHQMDDSCNRKIEYPYDSNLSDEKNKILKLCAERGEIKCKDVTKELSCEKTKAQDLLKELLSNDNKIESIGKARAIRYRLRTVL